MVLGRSKGHIVVVVAFVIDSHKEQKSEWTVSNPSL